MLAKLLFIDDEAQILEAYEDLFNKNSSNQLDDLLDNLDISTGANSNTKFSEQNEYEVHTANQGIEGIKLVQNALEEDAPFQVAFIDMRMPPGINGAETAKRIRQIDPDIEIVFVTAYSDIDLGKIVSEIGKPDKLLYLKKPFDSQEVKQLALNLSVKYFNTKIKDRFLANVSHELKTPLASILGFSQLLQDEDEDVTEEEKVEFLDIIYKNATLMKSLIDDLLSTVTDKKKSINKERMSVNSILNFVISTLKPEAQKKDLGLTLNCEVESFIYADRNKISQCFINVIGNAIKFTPKGSVTVTSSEDKENVYIKIQDTGIGIPSEYTEEIFKRFVRVEDDHHNVPGFGLGLSIVSAIVQEHNGSISVESKLGSGSLFTLRFSKVP